jgi:hypothetical protein
MPEKPIYEEQGNQNRRSPGNRHITMQKGSFSFDHTHRLATRYIGSAIFMHA